MVFFQRRFFAATGNLERLIRFCLAGFITCKARCEFDRFHDCKSPMSFLHQVQMDLYQNKQPGLSRPREVRRS